MSDNIDVNDVNADINVDANAAAVASPDPVQLPPAGTGMAHSPATLQV